MSEKKLRFNEKYLSQIPAIKFLIKLGYKYLTPEEVYIERKGKMENVILENILEKKLKSINKIFYQNQSYHFSEANIQTAIQRLKNVEFKGLLKTNSEIYNLLTIGTTLEQSIDGFKRSFDLKYIDWENIENNDFYVTAEFKVERNKDHKHAYPDIVLFVNGIPFVVIECKAPDVEVDQAVSQMLRNQNTNYIPKLFSYAQMVIATNKNESKYATVFTPMEFWSSWNELENDDKDIERIISKTINNEENEKVFSTSDFKYAKTYFNEINERLITEQDRTLFSLCNPKRLMELAYKFTIFDCGIKKIARYQQYFVVKSALERVKNINENGAREGGIVWHTQGSGKSLSMVFLTRNLVMDKDIDNPRVVLVTDRKNLDKQLSNTFQACGLKPETARSASHLTKLVKKEKKEIITTLVHKFRDNKKIKERILDKSNNIFILVDESHRTQFGNLAAEMRTNFPNACYIGFTGTPLIKDEKNNFEKFGGLIEPHYSIDQAVKDKAVVPLLYEGRLVDISQDKKAIDKWFERHTQGLSKEQKADLKRKYSRANILAETERVLYMQAFDISENFRKNWKNTGLKAQVVAPNRDSAIKMYQFFKEIGYVSSEVIISLGDNREGYDEAEEEPTELINKFSEKMKNKYGSEKEYNEQIINRFKISDEPEILIVVHKLITGFDAPRNTILYVCKSLKEHTLLQAIARVNRLYKDKEFGLIVDYANVLGELDKALTMYDVFKEFDEEDMKGTLTPVKEIIENLPQLYSNLWDVFKEVKNKKDEEEYEQLLSDEDKREEFYEALKQFAHALQIALSSEKYLMNADDEEIERYKADLKRFMRLRKSVKFRYAEAVRFKDYEPKIKKLLDSHIQADDVAILNAPFDIFDVDRFEEIMNDQGLESKRSDAAKADIIAYATQKTINEKMDEDPAFYRKFSVLIEQAIEEYKLKRLSETEYLEKMIKYRNDVVTKKRDNIPESIQENEAVSAYYGVFSEIVNNSTEDITVIATKKYDELLKKHWKVNFWDDKDAVNDLIDDFDDFLFDVIRDEYNVEIDIETMDEIIENLLKVSKRRTNK